MRHHLRRLLDGRLWSLSPAATIAAPLAVALLLLGWATSTSTLTLTGAVLLAAAAVAGVLGYADQLDYQHRLRYVEPAEPQAGLKHRVDELLRVRLGQQARWRTVTGTVIGRGRLRVARIIAPRWADVFDPDRNVCSCQQSLLSEVLTHEIRRENGRYWQEVTLDLQDWEDWLVELAADGSYQLTAAGEKELARLWGPHRCPPWAAGRQSCDRHGDYHLEPGDPVGCPRCGIEAATGYDLQAATW